MSVTDCNDEAHCLLTALNPEEMGKLKSGGQASTLKVQLLVLEHEGALSNSPSIQRCQSTTFGASKFHQHGADVNILNGSTLNVNAHSFQALFRTSQHM